MSGARRRAPRRERVDEQMRHVIAETLLGLADPLFSTITVASVDAATDASVADVYVHVRGAEARRAKALERLSGARGILQARINDQMHLRRTPHLRFHVDEAPDRGARVDELLADYVPLPDETEGPIV